MVALAAVLAGLLPGRLAWLADQQVPLWAMLALSALTVAVRVLARTLVMLAALRWGFTLPQVHALLLAVEILKTSTLPARMCSGVWRRSLLPPSGGASRPACCAGAN